MSPGEWPLLPDELWLTAWGCLPHESLARLGLTGQVIAMAFFPIFIYLHPTRAVPRLWQAQGPAP